MIVCPNCNHQNPDGAVQCEACYTPLPATTHCPNCGATVQADASFCGQCGFNLRSVAKAPALDADPFFANLDSAVPATSPDIPDLLPADALDMPEPKVAEPSLSQPAIAIPDPVAADLVPSVSSEPFAEAFDASAVEAVEKSIASESVEFHTQLQQQIVRLLHVQTNTTVELPQGLTVIHIGKPNERIPPNLDVSGFPNSEIVSRIHADIRVEGDAYYIEDVGSSNGTYINNLPLALGNRHRLRPGDRIALGKGDKVTFLFQLS